MFTKKCHHFIEVNNIKKELVLNMRRNGFFLGAEAIEGIVWDIVVDGSQFFDTFPTEEEFSRSPQESMPTSKLGVRHSLLSTNVHVTSIDTPTRWLPRTQYQPRTPFGLGVNRSMNQYERWGGGGAQGGSHVGGNGNAGNGRW